jgi:hypothetical protein
MSDKLWLLLAASFLAGLLSVWFLPAWIKDQLEYFFPFVMGGCLAFSFGLLVLASRLGRTDVTTAERFAGGLFFKKSPSS